MAEWLSLCVILSEHGVHFGDHGTARYAVAQERVHRFDRPGFVRWTRGLGHASRRSRLAMAGEHAEEMLRRERRIDDGEHAASALVGG